MSEAVGTAGTEFSSTDPDLVLAYLERMYHTGLKVSAIRAGLECVHRRFDGGSFALDEVAMPLTLRVSQNPLGSLLVVTLFAGSFERDCGGTDECFRAGDVFIDADPVLPSAVRLVDLNVQSTMLDLALLAQVATASPGNPGTRVPGPIRFTGYQPVSASAAANWKTTTSYVRVLLADTEAAAQPLIRGSAARLMAATALATFPNTALSEPTAQDRRDATTASVRRAIALIEQHPGTDLSLADIAAAAHVSIRAIQVAFRRHLDTTPMQYLRDVRLDRVHRELLTADPSNGATVTDIATRWGFYNHSRFATRYRRAFGVNPRYTLHSS